MNRRAERLRMKTDPVLPTLERATARVWSGPRPAARYGEYLCVMHAVVRASVPLLTAAGRRCADLGPADPVAEPLRAYLARHAVEERAHDAWLLADLRAIGWDPAEPLRRIPPPVVAEMVGAQYYWLLHHHPVGLLGYVAVLEQRPGPPELPDRLARLTGLPPRGFRTLRAHVALDPRHRAELDTLLDRLPLTAEHEALIALSALHTVSAATRLFAWLADRWPLGVSARER